MKQIERLARDLKTVSPTGPFKVERVTPRTSIELVRNDDYWDKTRIPKLKRLVLLPIADANTRIAALRSGEVDWVEYPAPDAIPGLKSAGFQIVTNFKVAAGANPLSPRYSVVLIAGPAIAGAVAPQIRANVTASDLVRIFCPRCLAARAWQHVWDR